jgi:hypothetical protein
VRATAAAAANVAVMAAFVTLATRRHAAKSVLSAPNLVTIGRASAAALLTGSTVDRRWSRPAWLAALAAATVADWIDGPLARRAGPTQLGALLDIEADSWLTLWSAAAAYRRGALPGWCLLPPTLRYVRPGPRPVRAWQRAAGVAQMAVLLGALAPWPPVRRAARRACFPATAAQLAAICS